MPAFITRSFSAGTPAGSCYTIYDGFKDTILLSDVRSSLTAAAHSPVIQPNGWHSAVWGTDKLEFGRFGYLPGVTPNEVAVVTAEDAASYIPAGRPFPSDRIERFLGYQGSRALFWSRYHGSTGGFRILDVDDLTQWDSPVIEPPQHKMATLCWGEETQLGPDGRIWMVDNQSSRHLWVYDGSWTDLGACPVAGAVYEVFVNDDEGPYLLYNTPAGASNGLPKISKWNGSGFETVLDASGSLYLTNGNGRGGVLLDDNKLVFASINKPYLYSGSYDSIYWIALVDLTLRNQVQGDIMGIGYIDTTEVGGENELAYLANVQKMVYGASDQEFYYAAVGRNLAPSQIKRIRYDENLRQSQGVYASLVGARINGRGGYTGTTDARLNLGTWWKGVSGGQKDVGFAPRAPSIEVAITATHTSDLEVQMPITPAADDTALANNPTSYKITPVTGVPVDIEAISWNTGRDVATFTLRDPPTRNAWYTLEITASVTAAGIDGIGKTASFQGATALPDIPDVTLTAAEAALQAPFTAADTAGLEQLRQALLRYAVTGSSEANAVRRISWWAHQWEGTPVLRGIVDPPSDTALGSSLLGARTQLEVSNDIRKLGDLMPAVLAELSLLGLPQLHHNLLADYARDEQPTIEVPLWCTCVLLGKALSA